jgi:hypothetical protein
VREFVATFENIESLLAAAVGEASERIVRAHRDAANQAKSHVVSLSSEVAADQGTFTAAWDVNDEPGGAILLNDAPHAAIVEEGSRPHWPPFWPILEYCARKAKLDYLLAGVAHVGPLRYDLGDQPIFKAEPSLEALRRKALGVARAIAARGTKPKYILRDAQPVFAEILREEIESALEAAS